MHKYIQMGLNPTGKFAVTGALSCVIFTSHQFDKFIYASLLFASVHMRNVCTYIRMYVCLCVHLLETGRWEFLKLMCYGMLWALQYVHTYLYHSSRVYACVSMSSQSKLENV